MLANLEHGNEARQNYKETVWNIGQSQDVPF